MNIQEKIEKIEKIREIVIMKNNPECKTYEEALKAEIRHGDCLLLCKDSMLSECTKDQRYALKIGLCATGKISTYDFKECYGEIDKILGLPINLERLLVALNQGIEEKDEGLFFSSGFEIRKILVDEGYNRTICNWQPSKVLEEQSEETIEKIYNVFILIL